MARTSSFSARSRTVMPSVMVISRGGRGGGAATGSTRAVRAFADAGPRANRVQLALAFLESLLQRRARPRGGLALVDRLAGLRLWRSARRRKHRSAGPHRPVAGTRRRSGRTRRIAPWAGTEHRDGMADERLRSAGTSSRGRAGRRRTHPRWRRRARTARRAGTTGRSHRRSSKSDGGRSNRRCRAHRACWRSADEALPGGPHLADRWSRRGRRCPCSGLNRRFRRARNSCWTAPRRSGAGTDSIGGTTAGRAGAAAGAAGFGSTGGTGAVAGCAATGSAGAGGADLDGRRWRRCSRRGRRLGRGWSRRARLASASQPSRLLLLRLSRLRLSASAAASASARSWKCLRTFSAASISIELEWVFFSVTPASGK